MSPIRSDLTVQLHTYLQNKHHHPCDTMQCHAHTPAYNPCPCSRWRILIYLVRGGNGCLFFFSGGGCCLPSTFCLTSHLLFPNDRQAGPIWENPQTRNMGFFFLGFRHWPGGWVRKREFVFVEWRKKKKRHQGSAMT